MEFALLNSKDGTSTLPFALDMNFVTRVMSPALHLKYSEEISQEKNWEMWIHYSFISSVLPTETAVSVADPKLLILLSPTKKSCLITFSLLASVFSEMTFLAQWLKKKGKNHFTWMAILNSTSDLLKEMHNPYVPSPAEQPPLPAWPLARIWMPALYQLCSGTETTEQPLVSYLSQVAFLLSQVSC